MTSQQIVAVGLLTEEDVAVLGKGFKRLFPVPNDAAFDDLLAKLDSVNPVAQSAARKSQP
ncbi:hypothetical protein [Sphingomonas sp. BK235]|uniref:hypothetical protein n=1 Tax=Sphingomonas sp. BK235 TaxID=2512131 RepID=UPI001FB578E3|nr:hypothetical protein [Sphingomonas sp. BK235]